MPDFSHLIGGRNENAGSDTSNTSGVSLTVASTWTEVDASTELNANGMIVHVAAEAAAALIAEIGIGGGGSEVSFVGPFTVAARRSNFGAALYAPIHIAAGSRLSARGDIMTGGIEGEIAITLLGDSFLSGQVLSRCTSYGTADASGTAALGTQVDPGGTAHTKGSYAQISASTDHLIRSIIINVDARDNTTPADSMFLVDIAVGSATSEQVIIGDLLVSQGNFQRQMLPNFIGPIPINIPAGTRLSARAQSEITDATDRLLGIQILGFD